MRQLRCGSTSLRSDLVTTPTGRDLISAIDAVATTRGIELGDAAMLVMTKITEQMAALPEQLLDGLTAARQRWVTRSEQPEGLTPWRVAAWEFLDAKNGSSTEIADDEDAAVRALICVLWDEGITSADDYDMTLDFFLHLIGRFGSLELPAIDDR